MNPRAYLWTQLSNRLDHLTTVGIDSQNDLKTQPFNDLVASPFFYTGRGRCGLSRDECGEPKTHDLIGPGNTETAVDAPDRSGVPVAATGAQVLWIEIPGTAPQHPPGTVACSPSTTIRWRTIVVLLPAVLRPLPDIAAHIIQTSRVRFLPCHRAR